MSPRKINEISRMTAAVVLAAVVHAAWAAGPAASASAADSLDVLRQRLAERLSTKKTELPVKVTARGRDERDPGGGFQRLRPGSLLREHADEKVAQAHHQPDEEGQLDAATVFVDPRGGGQPSAECEQRRLQIELFVQTEQQQQECENSPAAREFRFRPSGFCRSEGQPGGEQVKYERGPAEHRWIADRKICEEHAAVKSESNDLES